MQYVSIHEAEGFHLVTLNTPIKFRRYRELMAWLRENGTGKFTFHTGHHHDDGIVVLGIAEACPAYFKFEDLHTAMIFKLAFVG